MSEASDDPVARIPEGPLAEELHVGERLPDQETVGERLSDEETSADRDMIDDEHPDDEQD